jgi:hypothetical protein
VCPDFGERLYRRTAALQVRCDGEDVAISGGCACTEPLEASAPTFADDEFNTPDGWRCSCGKAEAVCLAADAK